MSTLKIQAGLRFLKSGKAFEITSLRTQHEKLEALGDDGDLLVCSVDEFRRNISTGSYELLAKSSSGGFHPVPTGWAMQETDSEKTERERRKKILSFVAAKRTDGVMYKDMATELSRYCSDSNLGVAPTERTIRSWRKMELGHDSALSPAWSRCGNRKQGPDDILLGVLNDVFQVMIAGNDKATLSAAWAAAKAMYDIRWNEKFGAESAVPRRSIRQLKKYLAAVPWEKLTRVRMDGRTARALTRTAVRIQSSGIFWDCVEMDATVLDILVTDDTGEQIGRPVLYVAIDVATGYIVGLHLTIQKPSAIPFVECLRFMLFPKPSDFDQRYGILNRIEVFGKAVFLKVDNGSEFIGIFAVEVVASFFGDSARCKPYTPQEKPHVERFNRTLKEYLRGTDGSISSSVTGERRSLRKDEKLLTLEELRGKVFRFAYDIYALRVNELRSTLAGKAVAPIDIWKKMREVYMEPVPVNEDEFNKSLYFKHVVRRVNHAGLSFQGWDYHSEDLARLYEKFGAGPYKISYSEIDASTIYVSSTNGNEMVPTFAKALGGQRIDRATAKELKARLRQEGEALDRRTFERVYADFFEEQSRQKTLRGKAKQARIKDLAKVADEVVRRTMPTTDTSLPPEPVLTTQLERPCGRTMGTRR